MSAAEALLIEHGTEAFTLTDVSRVGKVSIGSIYNRFSSKDELIRAVHCGVIHRIETEQSRIVMRARSRADDPVDLIKVLIDELGELLATFAELLRPLMLTAARDPVVHARGREGYDTMRKLVVGEILTQRALMKHPAPVRAANAVFRVAYGAFARELGFGMAETVLDETQWADLKADLGDMAAAFLFSQPVAALARPGLQN